VPVLLHKLYGARTILNTIIQSLTPHNSMLNMSLVKHSVTVISNLAAGKVVLFLIMLSTKYRTLRLVIRSDMLMPPNFKPEGL